MRCAEENKIQLKQDNYKNKRNENITAHLRKYYIRHRIQRKKKEARNEL